MILDCESYNSAMKSLSHVHGANTADVTRFLFGVDLDEEYRTQTIGKPANKYLAELFRSKFGSARHKWDGVCWFQLTRVPPNTDFAEGILPLHLALGKIWGTVVSKPKDGRKRANLQKTGIQAFPIFSTN